MFTGIIQELGSVQCLENRGATYRLSVSTKKIRGDVNIGDSVAVNGVCLTVTSIGKEALIFDVMAETIRKTGFSRLKTGDAVNLEGSLKANGSLGGHFVLGHIDCIGHVKEIGNKGDEYAIKVEFPDEYSPLIVPKGSVAIDGVSLTIGKAGRNNLTVFIIPHTLKTTTLDTKRSGDCVNLEFDIIGKYIARQRSQGAGSPISEEFLREHGF